MSGRKEKELINSLKQLNKVPVQVFSATVIDYDAATATLDVKDAYDTEFYNVRLKASINDSSFKYILVPTVGSTVLVGLIGNSDNALYMVMASELSTVYINVSGTQFQIDENGVFINEGANGPVLISQSLIDDLNAVKQDINSLKTVFNAWVVAPSDGGTALKLGAASWAGQSLNDTAIGDVTNDKLQH